MTAGDKIKCGGMMERGDLCLVEVLGFEWEGGEPCNILAKFGREEISLFYLSVGRGAKGDRNMSFCVKTEELAASRYILKEIEAEFQPRKVRANGPVVILTLYGPHFLERHTLASEVFAALCVHEIDVHTVCSSVNSISVVVDTHQRDRAVACLRDKFEWPE